MLPFYRLPFGIFQAHHYSSNDAHSKPGQMSHVVELGLRGRRIGAKWGNSYPVSTQGCQFDEYVQSEKGTGVNALGKELGYAFEMNCSPLVNRELRWFSWFVG